MKGIVRLPSVEYKKDISTEGGLKFLWKAALLRLPLPLALIRPLSLLVTMPLLLPITLPLIPRWLSVGAGSVSP